MKTQILLVDDEEHMLRLLQFVLKPIPASIHYAKRGDAAAIASRLVKVEPENEDWWINLAYSVRRIEKS